MAATRQSNRPWRATDAEKVRAAGEFAPRSAGTVSVSAVVLAFGEEPWLEECVEALLRSKGLGRLEIILVDNGCTTDSVSRIADRPGVVTLRPGQNLGFAGGCNFAAQHATGEVLAFVNSDAVVDAAALCRLAEIALEPGVGIATGSIRLADQHERLNSGGNEIHFLGVGWAGKFGELASRHAVRREVAGASGAGMAITRSLWEELGGFEDKYFAYHEDAELSLRCWQSGRSVVFVPEAIVLHHYEFSRNAKKLYLLERNRLIFVLTLYETRTLVALAPILAAFELAMLALAVKDGWWKQKLSGWSWIIWHCRWMWSRRKRLQSFRTLPDSELLDLFADRFQAGHLAIPRWLRPAEVLMSRYWALAQKRLRQPDVHSPHVREHEH